MASLLSNSAMVSGREEVYVAAMPLRATKGPPQLLMSAAYSLNFWDLQHFMVITKPSPHSQVLVFDFQPKDPEDIYVALAVLCGRPVPGAVLVRKLKKLPRSKCWLVGYAKADAAETATEFNKKWETSLRIGLNDCRDYTNGIKQVSVLLAAFLLGYYGSVGIFDILHAEIMTIVQGLHLCWSKG